MGCIESVLHNINTETTLTHTQSHTHTWAIFIERKSNKRETENRKQNLRSAVKRIATPWNNLLYSIYFHSIFFSLFFTRSPWVCVCVCIIFIFFYFCTIFFLGTCSAPRFALCLCFNARNEQGKAAREWGREWDGKSAGSHTHLHTHFFARGP